MKQNRKIDNLIKNLKTQTSSELDQRIDRLLNTQEETPKQPLKIWSKIMHSKQTKPMAAAIIIAALAGLYWITGSFDGATIAWAQVVEQLNAHEKYKCRQRVERPDGPPIPTQDIYHMNLSLRRQESEDGTIQIIDMQNEDAVTLELDPGRRTAIVTTLLGFGPRKDPDVIEMVKRFDQESTERLGRKRVHGKRLYGFHHRANEHNDFTVWIDPKTKLPVEIELKHIHDGQVRQTIFMDEFEFDFDLPMSAFSTEVPGGYEVKTMVQDYRPKSPRQVTGEDIQKNLAHTAYRLNELPWFEETCIIETISPLGSNIVVYLIAVRTTDENTILLAQSAYSDTSRMVWINDQPITNQTDDGIKLYTHPNGAIYAELFLKALAEAKPDIFDMKNLSDERFTRMIVHPDTEAVVALAANHRMTDEQLTELAQALVEIDGD